MSDREDDSKEGQGEKAEASRGWFGRALLVGVLGTIAGAATALLLTPWRGVEARRKVKESATAAGSAIGKKAGSLLSRDEKHEGDDEDD